MEVPHAVGIEGEVATFLYEAKNYLRDLTKVLNIFFGTKFKAASDFYDVTGKTKGLVPEWAEKSFGPNDHFSQMLAAECGWIGDLIKKRNAVEHPGGKSGTLHIENVKPTSDGKYLLPGWHRDEGEPTNLIGDLEIISDNLLTLAEEVLVSCILHKCVSPIIRFNQIPIEERNADCPIRLIAQIDHSKVNPPSGL